MHQWYLKLVLITCLVKLKAAQIIYAKTPSDILTCAAFIFCLILGALNKNQNKK